MDGDNMTAVRTLAFSPQTRPLHQRALITQDTASLRALLPCCLQQRHDPTHMAMLPCILAMNFQSHPQFFSMGLQPLAVWEMFDIPTPSFLMHSLGMILWLQSTCGKGQLLDCMVQLLCLVLPGGWLRNWGVHGMLGPSGGISMIWVAKRFFEEA